MRRIEKLPAAFRRFEKMGGVLDFAVFEDASGSEEEVLQAIPHALRPRATFDAERLRSLGFRRVRERKFFGEWYEPESGSLLRLGSHMTAGGSELQDPKLKALDKVKIVSSAAPLPEPGVGGQFAYAFSQTPYRLKARASEVQAVFEEIREYIVPSEHECQIWDWSSPSLPEVSDYFAAGMQWWGVYLFSVHVPVTQRLTIIAGSTTD